MDPWYQQAIAQSRADMDRRGMLAPPDPRTLPGAVQQQFGLLAGLDRPMLLPQPDRAEGGGPDWSNWTAPEWMYEGAKAVALPGHVMRGGEWSPEDVTNMALTVGGSAGAASMAGGAPRGALGMFGGRMAKTADHDALARAEKMAAGGASRDDIWRETGWFAGPDGKWRFEIDDSGASISQGSKISDALNHDDLLAAYPEVGGVDYESGVRMGRGQYGSYSPGDDVSGIPPLVRTSGGDRELKSTLHEIQHDIQRREGFAKGANQFGMSDEAFRIYKAIRKDMATPMSLEDYATKAGFDGDINAARGPYKDYVKSMKKPITSEMDRTAQQTAVERAYRLSMGEAEARNTEARMNMTPEQRRATPPWETLDVPEDELIVRMRSSGTPAGLLVPRQEQVPPWMRPEWGGT